MRNTFLFVLAVMVCNFSFGQADYRKRPALGLSFFANEFKTFNASSQKKLNSGLSLNYLEGLNNHIDISIVVAGSFLDYPIHNPVPFLEKSLLLELSSSINFKLNTDKQWFTPFLTTGAGVSIYKGYTGLFIPAGAGIQTNFKEKFYILYGANYAIALSDKVTSHVNYSIGIAGNIVKKKIKKAKTIHIPIKIQDTVAIIERKDRDGDGIIDIEDACPDIPGFVKYKGCPIPDTDKDGINDEEDKCISVPGFVRYQGCPVPDRDGDGLNDEEDRCPDKPGPVSNFGCPVIEQTIIEKINTAAKNIFFETGKANLLSKSYAALDSVVTILKNNISYKIDIEGHTDIIGTKEKNQILSDQRAASVKAYFVSKGIDESRITSAGFGQDRPVADNKTVAGRARNRRVEIKVRNY